MFRAKDLELLASPFPCLVVIGFHCIYHAFPPGLVQGARQTYYTVHIEHCKICRDCDKGNSNY